MVSSVVDVNVRNLHHNVHISQEIGGRDAAIVDLDSLGRPTTMLGHGHYFHDAPKHCGDPRWQTPDTPMDKMLKLCVKEKILRPKY